MIRRSACSLLAQLLLMFSACRPQPLYVDKAAPKPEFLYEEDSIIAQINSYDEKYLAFLTDQHFSIYQFKDKTIKAVANITHQIENVSEEHLASVMTHKYIAYITRDALYYFRLEDDRKNITEEGKQVFPCNYFNITEFSKDLTLNSRTYVMLMKTGPREIHMLNFKDSLFPSSRKLLISNINPTCNITQFKLIANAEKIALQFSDHSVHVIDPKINEEGNPELLPSTKVTVQEGYQIENISYDYSMNYLILLANYTKSISLQEAEASGTPRVCAMLYSCKNARYDRPIKVLDFKDMNLSAENLKNASIRRTGTKIMLVSFNNSLFSYNMSPDDPDSKFLGKLDVPEAELLAGYKLNNTFTLSNWIQTSKCAQEDTDMVYFRYLKLLTHDPVFCHDTNHRCQEPFVPGSKKREVALSFSASATALLVLLVVFIRGCTDLEKMLARAVKTHKRRDQLEDLAPEISSIG